MIIDYPGVKGLFDAELANKRSDIKEYAPRAWSSGLINVLPQITDEETAKGIIIDIISASSESELTNTE